LSPFIIRRISFVASLIACLQLLSCTSTATIPRTQDGQTIDYFGFIAVESDTPIQAHLKIRASKTQVGIESDLTIYIEGDGAHWLFQMVPPSNPTPRKSLVVSLATQDQSAFILYLAKPCQYVDIAQFKECDPSVWTEGRFSPDVIQLANDVIDKVLIDLPKVRLNLVGHSGGGTLATLLAARRNDVRCLVTLAAPLDIAAWTRSISVGPLRLSNNPADPSIQLKSIRQTHFFGENDSIVKRESIGNYRNFTNKTDFIVVSDFDHTKAWAEQWSILQKKSCLTLD
jgi:hypothetical protein